MPQVMVSGINKATDSMGGAGKVAVLEYLTTDLHMLAPLLAASPSLARALLGQALPLCDGRALGRPSEKVNVHYLCGVKSICTHFSEVLPRGAARRLQCGGAAACSRTACPL
jgi:hypothetical protein